MQWKIAEDLKVQKSSGKEKFEIIMMECKKQQSFECSEDEEFQQLEDDEVDEEEEV